MSFFIPNSLMDSYCLTNPLILAETKLAPGDNNESRSEDLYSKPAIFSAEIKSEVEICLFSQQINNMVMINNNFFILICLTFYYKVNMKSTIPLKRLHLFLIPYSFTPYLNTDLKNN